MRNFVNKHRIVRAEILDNATKAPATEKYKIHDERVEKEWKAHIKRLFKCKTWTSGNLFQNNKSSFDLLRIVREIESKSNRKSSMLWVTKIKASRLILKKWWGNGKNHLKSWHTSLITKMQLRKSQKT